MNKKLFLIVCVVSTLASWFYLRSVRNNLVNTLQCENLIRSCKGNANCEAQAIAQDMCHY